MGILENIAIFTAVIQQGGFSHAAKYLNLSNGLISRRIAQLESDLGVSLIKRTTRQLKLTPEGEVLWHHAERIQQELESALAFMQTSANKPTGSIRVSAPAYFGRHFLTPILMKFLHEYEDIQVDLILDNHLLDPIKDNIDITIRGTGYIHDLGLKNSTLHVKLLVQEKINIYASTVYLNDKGTPLTATDLPFHTIIDYSNKTMIEDNVQWNYVYNNSKDSILLCPKFNCNDIESSLIACASGYGIGRFTTLNAKDLVRKKLIKPILTDYNWGDYQLYAIYPHQEKLPQRSRLLLDFISIHLKNTTDSLGMV